MSLNAHLATTKRPATATSAQVVQAKRARHAEDKREDIRKALAEFNKVWKVKGDATLGLMQQSSSIKTVAAFLELHDKIRDLDNRYPLTPSEKNLVTNQQLILDGLLPLFKQPLTFDISSLTHIFVKQNPDSIDEEDSEDALQDQAQLHFRRMTFPSHDKLLQFLTSLAMLKPQYEGHLDLLLKLSQSLPAGIRYLHYGGFTIATTVPGRELDDEASEGYSLMTSACQMYVEEEYGQIEEFEAICLRFQIGSGGTASVKAARDEPRVDVYEGLLVDTISCFSLNTAPAGKLRLKLSARTRRGMEAVRNFEP